MNGIDWLIVGVLAFSSVLGFSRGLVREALSLVILWVAIMVASGFGPYAAPLLVDYIPSASLQQFAAFALVFVGVLLIGSLFKRFLVALIRASGLGGFDRLLGVLFGFLRGALIVMLVVVYLPQLLPVEQQWWWSQSVLMPHFIAYQDVFDALRLYLFAQVSPLFT